MGTAVGCGEIVWVRTLSAFAPAAVMGAYEPEEPEEPESTGGNTFNSERDGVGFIYLQLFTVCSHENGRRDTLQRSPDVCPPVSVPFAAIDAVVKV